MNLYMYAMCIVVDCIIYCWNDFCGFHYSVHKGDTHLVKFIVDSRTLSTQSKSACGTFVCLVQSNNTARKLCLSCCLVSRWWLHFHMFINEATTTNRLIERHIVWPFWTSLCRFFTSVFTQNGVLFDTCFCHKVYNQSGCCSKNYHFKLTCRHNASKNDTCESEIWIIMNNTLFHLGM